MEKRKLILIVYWVFFVGSLLIFGFGLRNEDVKLEMTVTALTLWIISFGLHKWLKNEDKKKNE